MSESLTQKEKLEQALAGIRVETAICEIKEELSTLISMARRSLQLEERLGRATKLLEEVFEDGLKTNSREWNREVNEFLCGPKAIRPTVQATPPVEPDALPLQLQTCKHGTPFRYACDECDDEAAKDLLP